MKRVNEYEILNGDKVLAEFSVVEEETSAYITNVKEKGMAPTWMNGMNMFIRGREIPANRENEEIVRRVSGCTTLNKWLQISHALSLNDTIWVREKGSSLQWSDVSLHDKKFNKEIAEAAIDGIETEEKHCVESPELATGGKFAKCWVKEDDRTYLVKAGSNGFANAGLEPYSEFYAQQILEALGIRHIGYRLNTHNDRVVTECDLMTSKDVGFISYGTYMKGKSIQDVIKDYDKLGYGKQAREMFIADAIMMNSDRHLNNFGFIMANRTYKIIGTAPLFDHNMSLLCRATERDLESIESAGKYIENTNMQHSLGGDFIKVSRGIISSDMRFETEMRKKLKNMRGFKFEKDKNYNLPLKRMDMLEKVINYQIDSILRA